MARQAKPVIERILAGYSVDAATGCWNWTRGGITTSGYGHLRIAGKFRQAHAVVYETLVGPIPKGLELDHLCRNRRCVNVGHLEPVTRAENMRRGRGTRLTWDKVRAIRAAFSAGEGSQRELAPRFGVDHSTISRIVRHERWIEPEQAEAVA